MKKIFFWLVLVFILCVCLEGLLQGLSFAFPKINSLLSRRELPLVPDPMLGWRPNPHYDDVKNRVDGFPGETVISAQGGVVALGDSQTYGYNARAEESWPSILGGLTQKKIYNLSSPGYGPLHSLLLWDQAGQFRPEIVIASFYAGNDIYDAFAAVYDPDSLVKGAGKFSDLKTQDKTILNQIAHAEAAEPLVSRFNRLLGMCVTVPQETKRAAFREFLAVHSKIYGFFRLIKRYIEQTEFKYSQNWESVVSNARQHPEDCLVYQQQSFQTVFMPLYRLAGQNFEDVRLREGHRISMEIYKRLARQAAENKIRFFVLMIPSKERVFEAVYERPPDSYKALVENEAKIWSATQTFLREEKIEFIDALEPLQRLLRNGQKPYSSNADNHLNAVGYKAVGEHAAASIGKS